MTKQYHDSHGAFYDLVNLAFPGNACTFMNYGMLKEPLSLYRTGEARLRETLSENLADYLMSLAQAKPRKILDIGCGRGGIARYLAARYKIVVGVDLNPANISFCQKAYAKKNLRILLGDAQNLPLSSGSFDLAYSIEVMHCARSKLAFLKEASRILKPGGALHLADLLEPNRARRISRSAKQAGFTEVFREDISASVINSLECLRVHPQFPPGKDFLSRTVSTQIQKMYSNSLFNLRKGRVSYLVWRLTKAR